MSLTDNLDRLANGIIERRPLVLLLGQSAWADAQQEDPLLVAALKRSDHYLMNDEQKSYLDLLSSESLPQEFYDWLADSFDRRPRPEWMEPITALSFNAIFTSSIDPTLVRDFRYNGREVEVVLSTEDNPVTPRHRQRLHITYLFGRSGERQQNEFPPRSSMALRTRSAIQATPLLARIVETTTPLGTLLIDGFVCGRDWMATEMLAAVLSAFQPGQVLWFGWKRQPRDESSKLIEELAEPDGPVILVPERLSTALRSLELAHRIDLSTSRRAICTDAISIGDNLLQLPPATRLKTSTAVSILDDTWLAPLQSLGQDSQYAEFRRFHGFVDEPRRIIEGIRRGFAIRRTFENDFKIHVDNALSKIGRVQDPFLIHGQSGSGKSLALARLAFDIRNEKHYPVLFASRTNRLPGVDEIDEFCLRAEDAGASATLLVCDANAPAFRYRDLVQGFLSRGRRVVVVGSAYRIVDKEEECLDWSNEHLLQVPADLTEGEMEALSKLFERFTGIEPRVSESPFLLPAVYRMLPDVRPRLAAGLANEALTAEQNLRQRGQTRTSIPKPVGQLGQALMNAGLIDPRKLLEQQLEEFLGCMTDAASHAINYVMVPGKFDCPVPINLLMRAVGSNENLTDVASLFAGIDLFRWSSNDEGDIFIHPRLRLEADLISARRLGTKQAEAEIAIRLLSCANPSEIGHCERRFVLDLVQRFGPDGPYGKSYFASYMDIARALTDIRKKRGILDPSLMLQEATLRRSYFRDRAVTPSLDPASTLDPASALEEAREVVDLALEEFGGSNNRGLKRMCANLRVERAAIYGYLAYQRMRQNASLDEIWNYYLAARDASRNAISAADSSYAIDISLWVPTDLLNGADWEPVRRGELIADIRDAMERVEPESLDPEQREKYFFRCRQIGKALDDPQLEEKSIVALEKAGSKAGFFLRAHDIGGVLTGSGKAKPDDRKRAESAARFLEKHYDLIRDDARCLRYLLKCQWMKRTGTYLFGSDRSPLPATENDVISILQTVEQMRTLEGALGEPRTRYLLAVLMWRLAQEQSARELWRELSRDTEYTDRRRIIRHHVWSDTEGKPRLFHGRITNEEPGRGRFRVQVDDIRQEIELLQRDFREVNFQRGTSVTGGFHIAFNYIGPIADNPSRRGERG